MVPESCQDEVIDLLKQLRARSPVYDGDPEAGFNAEQNALVMVDAERYYRVMVRSDQNSWNVRDIHMADTIDRLMDWHGEGSKAIIWAHNTHIGDARFTDMAAEGMVNIGQLMRERKGEAEVFLVGFGTHHGTVIAGKQWDAPMEVMGVPDAVESSWEDNLHRVGKDAFFLLLRGKREEDLFTAERGNRAIGVVYHPEYERYGNYVPTILPGRYDAFIFIDESQALHPLHIRVEKEPTIPEMYPWGL
jgi:erythromycin esterase-like protein